MGKERNSYRNPFVSAFIIALLYFVISNYFYWYFSGELSFVPFEYFNWVEYFLGTVTMGIVVLVVEFLRNLLGRKGSKAG
jgi:hypothetical protein